MAGGPETDGLTYPTVISCPPDPTPETLCGADTPPAPFRVPPGIKFVRVDLKTGLRASADDTNTILEAFKPDEEPDDGYSMIGFANATADASAGAGASPYPSAPPPPPPPSARQDGSLSPNGFW